MVQNIIHKIMHYIIIEIVTSILLFMMFNIDVVVSY